MRWWAPGPHDMPKMLSGGVSWKADCSSKEKKGAKWNMKVNTSVFWVLKPGPPEGPGYLRKLLVCLLFDYNLPALALIDSNT